MKKSIAITLVVILAAFLLTGGALISSGFSVSTGRCLIAINGSVLLIQEDHGPIRLSDRSPSGDLFAGLTDGDRLLILHDGIAESYPAQTGAYFLLRTGSGSRADLPAEQLEELAQLGWIKLSASPAVSNSGGTPDASAEPDSYAFDAQYIRTDGYQDGVEYPQTVVIRSRGSLDTYYEENRDTYALGRRDKVYADTTIGFLDACDKYDDAYFAEKDVVFLLLEEGSGSIRHEVTGVRYDGTEWVISVRRITPEVGTCDMAEWHIMVELQMGKVIGENDPIRVEFVK